MTETTDTTRQFNGDTPDNENWVDSIKKEYPSDQKTDKRVVIILNPAAGHDRPILKTFNRVFRNAGYDWDIRLTKKFGDGQRLARQAIEEGVDAIAVYGGDGSLMDVAWGMAGSNVPLALLPGGTGNVMSVELGIPRDLTTACKLIVAPARRTVRVDMGQIQVGNDLETGFLLRASIGIEATVLEGTRAEYKERYGIFAYIIAALEALREPQNARYTLTIDGNQIECEGFSCIIANAGNLGVPGVNLAPGISLTDGLLDVFVIRKADLAGLFSLAASIIGAPDDAQNMLHWKAREVHVISNPVQPVQGDGDLLGQSPIHAKAVPRAVDIIVPETPLLPEWVQQTPQSGRRH